MSKRSMPPERAGLTLRARLPLPPEPDHVCPECGHVSKAHADLFMKVYINTGVYEDGTLGEIFIRADKAGTFTSGVLDGLAIAISVGLQHGVPLEQYTSKLKATKFDPAGITGLKDVPICTSPLDLLARWLDARYGPGSGKKVSTEASQAVTIDERPKPRPEGFVAPGPAVGKAVGKHRKGKG